MIQTHTKMPNMPTDTPTISLSRLHDLFITILGAEKSFYKLAAIYGVAISLFTLAVPFSVQILITTLTNTALQRPVIILSLMLLLILSLYGLLVALQQHVLEATLPNGERWAMDACVVVKVENGLITRLDEYLDSAKSAALRPFGR